MNVLALDTACGETAACLLMHGKTWLPEAPSRHSDGKTRSVRIIPLLDELLRQAGADWRDLQGFVFSHGPGSFTGLRIAAATLAGLNSYLQRPVISVSSLAVTSRQLEAIEPVWILEDARAGEVYAGRYQAGRPLSEDTCLNWSELLESIEPSSYACHGEPAIELPGWQRLPLTIDRNRALAEEVAAKLSDMENLEALPRYPEPVYLQLSQAERNANA